MGRIRKADVRSPTRRKTKAVRFAKPKKKETKAKIRKIEVSKDKLTRVIEIQQELGKYSTVAILDMSGLPSSNLQAISRKIKDRAKLIYAKKNFTVRAIESNEKLKILSSKLGQNSALLLSNLNAFELFGLLKANMSDAPAKAGQVAPFDLIVKAGPTPFTPGPVLTELGSVGIKAGVEGGKVAVKQDSTVVKAGQPISDKAASILLRLGLKPMKIGLNLTVALENGELYSRNILNVDVDEIIQQIKSCYLEAFKLSIGTGLVTEETVKYLLQKAHREALILSEKIGEKSNT